MGERINNRLVSVIIPAFNAERTIKRALDSVKGQSQSGIILEVIVINDGSSDDTRKIVEQYISDYPLFPIRIINKENGGVSSARNIGLKIARGEWIALLDSDDEWLQNKLEIQFDILKNYNNIDFMGGNHTEKTIRILGRKIDKIYKPSIKDLCIKMFPQTSTVIFKKKIYEEIGGYDEKRQYCEDGQFFLRICEKYNYYYIPNQLVIFDGGKRGFGGDGLSGNLKEMQNGVMQNIKELYQRKSISLPFYIFIYLYCEIKYIRRVIICLIKR